MLQYADELNQGLYITELCMRGVREPNRTIIAHRKAAHSRTRGVRNARILVRHIVTSHPVQTLSINVCTHTRML